MCIDYSNKAPQRINGDNNIKDHGHIKPKRLSRASRKEKVS